MDLFHSLTRHFNSLKQISQRWENCFRMHPHFFGPADWLHQLHGVIVNQFPLIYAMIIDLVDTGRRLADSSWLWNVSYILGPSRCFGFLLLRLDENTLAPRSLCAPLSYLLRLFVDYLCRSIR